VGVAGRVARGSFIILARDVIANFAAFLGVAIVARVLGPGEYGLASVALVYPGLVGAVVGLGLGSAITRFASSGGTSAGRYVYSGLWASAASGTAGAVAVLALAPLFASLLNRPGIAFGVSTLSLYVFALILFSAVSAAFLGLGWYGGGAALELVRVFVRVAVSVGLALAGFGYLSVLWGFSLGYLAGALVGLLWLVRRLPPVGPSLTAVAELLRYSLPLHVPSLVSSAVGQALMGLLAVRASDIEIGNLAAASALLIIVNMVANAIGTAAFSSLPLLLGDDARLRSAVDKSVFYMNVAVVPVALGVAVFAGPLVRLAYGHAYGAAPLYLSLLAAAYVYNVLAASAVTLYANVVGRTGFTGLVTVADAGVRALAAVPLVVHFGVWGTSWRRLWLPQPRPA